MGNDVIDICYAISDKRGNYTKIAGTSICSVLMNTAARGRLHILHDGTINEVNRQYLLDMVEGKFGQQIFFYDVREINAHIWTDIMNLIPNLADSRLSIATFFRLTIGDIFKEIKRVIYLDADTIVNLDIRELWREPISPSGLAGAPDVVLQRNPHGPLFGDCLEASEYFNAGVLLIDMVKFRQMDNLLGRSMDFLMEKHPLYLDQDVLNYLFPHSCTLPGKYNAFINEERHHNAPVGSKIYHYVSGSMGVNTEEAFNELYLRYFTQTPWCDGKFIGNLARKISPVDWLDKWITLMNRCAGKRRLIIGLERLEKPIMNLLELGKLEEYIPFEKLGERNLDFNKHNDILLIFLEQREYAEIKERLEYFGLQENTHFINTMFIIETLDEDVNHCRAFLFA